MFVRACTQVIFSQVFESKFVRLGLFNQCLRLKNHCKTDFSQHVCFLRVPGSIFVVFYGLGTVFLVFVALETGLKIDGFLVV